MRNNVIHMYPPRNVCMEDLFDNMNRAVNTHIHNLTVCVDNLDKRAKRLKTALIATILILIGCAIGFGLAINDIKTKPVTVYVEGQPTTVDINKLPIPPLEELK